MSDIRVSDGNEGTKVTTSATAQVRTADRATAGSPLRG